MHCKLVKMPLKKLAALLLCVAAVFVLGQMLAYWSTDDEDLGDKLPLENVEVISRVEVPEEWKHGIPARSDMMKQLEMMEHGDGKFAMC